MPTQSDKDSFDRKRIADSGAALVPAPPPLPADVKKRFPSLEDWERRMKDWAEKQVGKPA